MAQSLCPIHQECPNNAHFWFLKLAKTKLRLSLFQRELIRFSDQILKFVQNFEPHCSGLERWGSPRKVFIQPRLWPVIPNLRTGSKYSSRFFAKQTHLTNEVRSVTDHRNLCTFYYADKWYDWWVMSLLGEGGGTRPRAVQLSWNCRCSYFQEFQRICL